MRLTRRGLFGMVIGVLGAPYLPKVAVPPTADWFRTRVFADGKVVWNGKLFPEQAETWNDHYYGIYRSTWTSR